MSFRNRIVVSALIALGCWIIFSWPLALEMNSSVASGSQNLTWYQKCTMMPGDHLQLMYHFWLFEDMVRGETPWFHNLYEFNLGDDDALYRPHHYFVPFSIFYAIFRILFTQALSWNLSSLISFWLTFLFTWALIRQFVRQERAAAGLALVGLLFPYRINLLFAGSPAGFAICWVPCVFLGLKKAILDEDWRGGALAGMGILFAVLGDSHIFYFTSLSVPFWSLLMLACKEGFQWKNLKAYKGMVKAFIPMLILVGLACAYSLYKLTYVTKSIVADRTLKDVAAHSPHPIAVFDWLPAGHEPHVFTGVAAAGFVALGLVFLFAGGARKLGPRKTLVFAGLAFGYFAMVCAALGPFGIHGGVFYRYARHWLPGYDMIRQSGKIMSVAPTIMALCCTFAFISISTRFKTARGRNILLGIFLVLAIGEYRYMIRPSVCALDKEQLAYKAVVDDAQEHGYRAHALIIPLWPGEASDTSVYEYYASIYRLRMVNGYSPVVAKDYFDEVFRPFQPVNQGIISSRMFDSLQDMGVRYILIHEDVFPEKVSPYPVGMALQNLLTNPRLTQLGQDGSVWAFRIEDKPAEAAPDRKWTWYAPARRYEAETSLQGHCKVVQDQNCQNGAYLSMSEQDAVFRTKPTFIAFEQDARWMIRCRGQGRAEAQVMAGGLDPHVHLLEVNSDDWQWLPAPIPAYDGVSSNVLRILRTSGSVDVDACFITAGEDFPAIQPGEYADLPLPAFFRSGYINLENESVVIRQSHEGDHGLVFYGPYLPLESGQYRYELAFTCDAPGGTEVAVAHIDSPDGDSETQAMVAGQTLNIAFTQDENLLHRLDIIFKGNAPLVLESIRLHREE